jgi:thiamine pyrophosphokinase
VREPGSVMLLLNGAIADPILVRKLVRRCGLLVCADGGARHARDLGLVPDVVVGDMDSIPRPLPRTWNQTFYCCDFDEDCSDFAKALSFVVRAGCRRLYLAGVFGGRLDHAMVNISLIRRIGEKMPCVIVDRGLAMILGPGRYRLGLSRGQLLSLLSADTAARVSVSGVRYPLRRAALAPGSRGLSNVAAGRVSLNVHSGRVWAMSPELFRF